MSINRAGSCGIMILIIDDDLYVVNVGDSRAVMGKNSGKDFRAITIDHKPMEENEYKRIT